MSHERRSEPRYVVDGLVVDIDGEPREILDISASAVRLWRASGCDAYPDITELRVYSEPGFAAVDFVSQCTLLRVAPGAAVYRYTPMVDNWPRLLRTFDSFQDISLPMLEVF